jgi:RNA polymerase sigma-70 factor (ECF subfamily)
MAADRVDAQTILFEQALNDYQRPILRLCYRLLGDLADAQDVAQEVFLRAYKHRGELSADRSPSPWLYRIAVNACRDRQRARRPMANLEDVPLAAGASPESEAAAGQMKDFLMQGLKRLPEKQRQALVLRDLEGMPAAEAAEVLGSTEGTVRSQASMARATLRTWFEERLKPRD